MADDRIKLSDYTSQVVPLWSVGINKHKYAHRLFYKTKDHPMVTYLNNKFENMQMLFGIHGICRSEERRMIEKVGDGVSLLQVFKHEALEYQLFLGKDWNTFTYEDVDALLENTEELKLCKAKREEYKAAFLGGLEYKLLKTPEESWLVERDVDLPWTIPVDLNWFNPMVMGPDKIKWNEMYNSGRIVEANAMLYKDERIHGLLVKSLFKLQKHVMYDFDGMKCDAAQTKNLAENWHEKGFVWVHPLHEVVNCHVEGLNMSSFVMFDEALVRKNLTKVIVPRGMEMSRFAGEVRFRDEYKGENYAVQFNTKQRVADGDFDDGTPITNLIITNANGDDGPRVCNGGFSSNERCNTTDSPPWFINMSSSIKTSKKKDGTMNERKKERMTE